MEKIYSSGFYNMKDDKLFNYLYDNLEVLRDVLSKKEFNLRYKLTMDVIRDILNVDTVVQLSKELNTGDIHIVYYEVKANGKMYNSNQDEEGLFICGENNI